MTTPTSGNPTAETGLPPNYYTHKLANGLQLVGQRMPSLASVTFGIQVAAGLRDEPGERGGLTNLLSDMMFQGTETRDVRQLTDEFEAIGARRGAETGTEFARYSAQIVGARLEKALELFADILMHPTFPEAEFEQMRAIQLQEIRRRDDEPMRRIFDLVREKFYAGTSLGRRALGTKESVEELEPEHLLSFWSARYHAKGSLLSIAGNFDWENVVALVEKYLGGWKGSAKPSPVETPHPQDAVNIELQDGNQEHIGMAYPFPKYGDPDYYAASVMTEIFGGGMSSRLFREVREKRGLVYSVSAMYAPNGIFGAGYIYAGTTPEKAHETVQVTLDEMRAMQSEGVTADELERAKVQLKSELVMRGESSAARMGALARAWWFEGRLIPISEITEAVDAVSQEQILGLLKRFPLTSPLVIGAIGPRTEAELIGDALTAR
ncbi:MAG TPA: pitrilysin family protein [Ktedonobacterales bacterium]|jgi:predicted Zn-dependent peptidase